MEAPLHVEGYYWHWIFISNHLAASLTKIFLLLASFQTILWKSLTCLSHISDVTHKMVFSSSPFYHPLGMFCCATIQRPRGWPRIHFWLLPPMGANSTTFLNATNKVIRHSVDSGSDKCFQGAFPIPKAIKIQYKSAGRKSKSFQTFWFIVESSLLRSCWCSSFFPLKIEYLVINLAVFLIVCWVCVSLENGKCVELVLGQRLTAAARFEFFFFLLFS